MSQHTQPSKAKQEWLANKLKNFKNTRSSLGISPQVRPEHLPLSFSQVRLWFLEQWEPESSAYLLPYAWRLQGPLDITALSCSLDHLTARHETLRTTFTTVEDHPIQIIETATPLTVPLIDLSEQTESTKESEYERLVYEEARQGFNLQTGPLIRVKLIRLGKDDHVFLLTFHHIITDGWSMGIFFKELSSLYTSQVTGESLELPPLPIQFADFAIWQRNWLQGKELDRQKKYWQTQLQNAPHQLDLPTDTPRPPQQTYQGQSLSFSVPSPLGETINALCHTQGVTLFMALMATFLIFLFRYTGQRDILVGTPIAGRSHAELENLIGFFVNTLVLRMQIKDNPSFHQVLTQVKDTCLESYEHQDFPFEQLVELLKCERDPSRHPIFQVLFQLHHRTSDKELTLPNVAVMNVAQATQTAKFDLLLAITSDANSLKGTFNFNTDIFANDTIRRFASNFQTLLEGLVKNPTHPISQIPSLTVSEQKQLLSEWNTPNTLSTTTTTVHGLFAEQMALTPDAIALVSEDEQLTYRELNERAERLAEFLQTKGVGLEVRIGICLERSLDLIISLLGVLKSGGAYVPLDPSTPVERLYYMIDTANTPIVITSEARRAQFESCKYQFGEFDLKRRLFLTLSMAWGQKDQGNYSIPPPIVHTENLAYVMYTSGSMGRPKGVEITHRNIVRLISKPTYFQWPTNPIFVQMASPAFDAATFEIWTCLVNGGRLVLGPSQLPSLDTFGEFLQKFHVTILWLTAGLFHQIVDWNVQTLSSVERLLAGGDVLSPRHVKLVVDQLPGCQLINGYGPTENTTFTCCFSLPPQTSFTDFVPIGSPIEQTQVYILDSQQYLLPSGAPGELCIGGLGLARGYLYQPGLTAEKFIPHPYSTLPGDRIYRSGDIVRYQKKDHLIFLGRRDRQVKIRGYRVECSEIETALTKHSGVQETIVLPWEDHMGNTRLVAYIISKKDSTPSVSDLRFFLSQILPLYMIPAGYVFLDAFPLTSNGKVDRNKLPPEPHPSSHEEHSFISPRNSLERQLAQIWEAVLGRQPIGVTDNFFHLGGESLMAVRLCSEIERTLQQKIPVPLIFHTQTIERLAKKIEQNNQNETSSLMLSIQIEGSNPPIFCVCFGDTFSPYLKRYPEQPLYMFFNQGYDGKPARYTTVQDIASHYLEDIKTVQPQGPYYLAGYSFGGMVAYEMAQQLRQQGESIGILILLDPTTALSQRHSFRKDLDPPSMVPHTTLYLKFAKTIFHAISWRLQAFQKTMEILIKKFAYNVYFQIGSLPPTPLRRFYTTTVVQEASKSYTPSPYPWKIILFQTSKHMKTGWKNLALGGLETYDIPAEHLNMVKEPYTEMVLLRFMSCLESTRTPKDTRPPTKTH